MSEQSQPDYDPRTDPDSDPGSLNPRTGAAAAGSATEDEDTDAESANLNPRDDGAADEA